MVKLRFRLCYAALRNSILRYTLCAALHCAILHCAMLSCAMSCCAVLLCCAMLCDAKLCCTAALLCTAVLGFPGFIPAILVYSSLVFSSLVQLKTGKKQRPQHHAQTACSKNDRIYFSNIASKKILITIDKLDEHNYVICYLQYVFQYVHVFLCLVIFHLKAKSTSRSIPTNLRASVALYLKYKKTRKHSLEYLDSPFNPN